MILFCVLRNVPTGVNLRDRQEGAENTNFQLLEVATLYCKMYKSISLMPKMPQKLDLNSH